jgi:hypothetical protein
MVIEQRHVYKQSGRIKTSANGNDITVCIKLSAIVLAHHAMYEEGCSTQI